MLAPQQSSGVLLNAGVGLKGVAERPEWTLDMSPKPDCLFCAAQKVLEDTVLDSVLAAAFDATPERLEAARKPLKASLHAMALKAARSVIFRIGLYEPISTTLHASRIYLHSPKACTTGATQQAEDDKAIASLGGGVQNSEFFVSAVCRPVSEPLGYLMGPGPPAETKASKAAWAELVKGLRVRGPASKTDPSLAAGLMRLTGAGGEAPPQSST